MRETSAAFAWRRWEKLRFGGDVVVSGRRIGRSYWNEGDIVDGRRGRDRVGRGVGMTWFGKMINGEIYSESEPSDMAHREIQQPCSRSKGRSGKSHLGFFTSLTHPALSPTQLIALPRFHPDDPPQTHKLPLPHVTPPPTVHAGPLTTTTTHIRPTRRQSPHLLVRLVPLYAPKAPSAPYISHTRRSFSPLPAIARSKLRVQYYSLHLSIDVPLLSFCYSVLALIATALRGNIFP
jgi:hypothetical protein